MKRLFYLSPAKRYLREGSSRSLSAMLAAINAARELETARKLLWEAQESPAFGERWEEQAIERLIDSVETLAWSVRETQRRVFTEHDVTFDDWEENLIEQA